MLKLDFFLHAVELLFIHKKSSTNIQQAVQQTGCLKFRLLTECESSSHKTCVYAGSKAYLQFYLSNFTNTPSLVDAVRRIPYCSGSTNTTGSLRVTRTEIFNTATGDRPAVPNVIVLITDGNPTREVEFLDEEVQRVKNQSVRIVGMGVTNAVSKCATTQLLPEIFVDGLYILSV